MKNILHVVNIYFVIPYFLGDQLLYFRKKGYREHIICSHSDEIKEYSESHLFDYKEVSILRVVSIWKDLKAVFYVSQYIRKYKIDIVTGHTPKGGLIAMLSAYLMHVPIRLYFRHGLVYETTKGYKRKFLILLDHLSARLATKVVCVSPSVCQISLRDKLNSSSKQVLLNKGTCNGIDTDRFNKYRIDSNLIVLLKEKFLIYNDSFVVGYVGRLVKDKGIVELVDAFCDIKNQCPKAILLLVGMVESRNSIPAKTEREINTNSSIICTGYVDNCVIENYYAMMDVFVLPSYREGFPTSVLEASSMELPIVTTKATGCIDSIVEGETGVFVECERSSIASAVMKYLNNVDLRILHGKKGRKFVQENFEQHIIWEAISKLYDV